MISSLSINLCFNGYPHPSTSDLDFLIEICPLSVSWLSWLSLLSLTFHIFVFSRTAGSLFQPNMAHGLLGWKEFKLCSNEGPWPYPRGDNSDTVKIHSRLLKYFPRTSAWTNFNHQTWSKESVKGNALYQGLIIAT